MSASVRIEDCAFGDSRYARLAEAAHYRGGHYEALGRMAHLWRECTERGAYVVSEATIRVHLGRNGVAAIIEADLGSMTDVGIRVHGTQGRIEWLNRKRTIGALHGPKGAEFGKLGGRPPKTKPGDPVSAEPGDRVIEKPGVGGGDEPGKNPPAVVAVVPALAVQQKQKTTTCPETKTASSPGPPSPVLAEMEFPCDGGVKRWTAEVGQLAEWRSSYPALDLVAEIRKARAWILADPARRKTARGMPKFLVNWFNRSQNNGSGRGGASVFHREPTREDSIAGALAILQRDGTIKP